MDRVIYAVLWSVVEVYGGHESEGFWWGVFEVFYYIFFVSSSWWVLGQASSEVVLICSAYGCIE